MRNNWETVLLVVTVMNTITYCSIRELLLSIVWLNIGGKQHRFYRFIKTIKRNKSLLSRIDMMYLIEYVVSFRSDFIRWWKAKRLFAIIELALEIIFFGIGLNGNQSFYFTCFIYIFLAQSFCLFILLRLQYGIGGHHTKYDKLRKKAGGTGDGPLSHLTRHN